MEPSVIHDLVRGNASERARPILAIGWVAKGLLFVIIGGLAIEIGRRGRSGEQTDQVGALASLTEVPAGRLVVFLVAIGLLAFAIWQLWAAVVHDGDDVMAIVRRIGWLGLAVAYALLAETAVRIAVSGRGEADGGGAPTSIADRLLDLPAGAWIVGAIGVGTAIVAIYHVHKGARGEFLDDLDTAGLDHMLVFGLRIVGTAGYVARGVVLGIVGWLFVDAARDDRASRAGGLDGAVDALARTAGGFVLLVVTGVGLIAAGLYDIASAPRRQLDGT